MLAQTVAVACTMAFERSKAAAQVASYPGAQGGRRESAWYTLFAHAFNFPDIWENCILQ